MVISDNSSWYITLLPKLDMLPMLGTTSKPVQK